ncbi:MAG: hypothetical protein ACRECX_14170 [Methyloceanibacter sp.]|uniref:hypothetical protein n=1 Tax=Methyloceanibacter sp. TaxID=1965321 RepID=UPI003D6D55A5
MGLVFLIELAFDSGHLAALEVGNLDGTPTFGGADHGAEHKLEDGLLAEGIGNDLEAPALLEEQALGDYQCPYCWVERDVSREAKAD